MLKLGTWKLGASKLGASKFGAPKLGTLKLTAAPSVERRFFVPFGLRFTSSSLSRSIIRDSSMPLS